MRNSPGMRAGGDRVIVRPASDVRLARVVRPARVVRRAARARPAPGWRPAPGARPVPATARPQRPRAAVSYQPEHRWPGGFTGQFTIINEGRQAIGSWQLAVTLPGDDVRDVQGADWYTSGDTLVMEPPHGGGALRPGSSLTISIVAYGSDGTPASCSINGRICQR